MVAGLIRDIKCEIVKCSFDLVAEIADEVRIYASQFISPL